MKLSYNERGQQLSQERYEFYDTTKVESWKNYTYDAKGRMLVASGGQFYGGQKLEGKFYETSYTKDKKGRERTISHRYSDYKIRSDVYGHDSISGLDSFYVSYEYSAGDVSRMVGSKTVFRSRKKNGFLFEDEISYSVFGKTETVQKITSRYYKLDKNGHFLEEGEIDYEEAYMDYSQ